jgi:hypothetical protein
MALAFEGHEKLGLSRESAERIRNEVDEGLKAFPDALNLHGVTARDRDVMVAMAPSLKDIVHCVRVSGFGRA